MKLIYKITTILSITTLLKAQDSTSEKVIDITGNYQDSPHQEEIIDITGDDQEISLPRLTISNLFNTRLSNTKRSKIENFLSLPDWADGANLIDSGLYLIKSLHTNRRYDLIKDLIKQRIERIKANQSTQVPPRKRKRTH